MLDRINRVRTDPQGYAAYMENFRACYSAEGSFRAPGGEILHTHEGIYALNQAIQTLQHAPAQTPFTASDLLAGAGRELINAEQQSGRIGHGGAPFERMQHYGAWQNMAGENVAYGALTAEQVVYNLIVDDGVRSRGHLKNILQPGFRVAGVSQGSHPIYRTICVIDFASDFTSKGGSADVERSPDAEFAPWIFSAKPRLGGVGLTMTGYPHTLPSWSPSSD